MKEMVIILLLTSSVCQGNRIYRAVTYPIQEFFSIRSYLDSLLGIFHFKLNEERPYFTELTEIGPFPNIQAWGPKELCLNNEYVIGMNIAYQTSRGHYDNPGYTDDMGLVGVVLYCSTTWNNRTHVNKISSKMVTYEFPGIKQSTPKFCQNGFANGFQFKIEPPQGAGEYYDDTGATNFKLFCNDGSILSNDLSHEWGNWGEKKHCPQNQAICGLKTNNDINDEADNAGIIGATFYCCKIKDPLFDCEAHGNWVSIFSYQNQHKSNVDQRFTFKVGITNTDIKTDSTSVVDTNGKTNTFTIGVNFKYLESKFETSTFKSEAKSKGIENMVSFVWESERISESQITLEPNSSVRIFQFVGNCGPFKIGSLDLKSVQY